MASIKSKIIPALDTVGARNSAPRIRAATLWRSFATRLVVLIAIFVAVPIAIYLELRAADAEKTELLLKATRAQGRIVAESIRPTLRRLSPATVRRLNKQLGRIKPTDSKIKVLFRPRNAAGPNSFFYVAAAPPAPQKYLKAERDQLVRSGALANVRKSCNRVESSTTRYSNPAGAEELLISLTPIQARAGCWVVMTSLSTSEFLGSSLSRPYWEAPEVQVAATIYLLLAAFVVWLFLDGWQAIRGFTARARAIRGGNGSVGSFAADTRVPELVFVAREFDALVARLHDAANAIRFAAEENAHAFKTPIATIAQSIEPLRRASATVPLAARSTERIEQAVWRLDDLVSAARRMDEAAAEALDAAAEPVELGALVRRIGAGYRETLAEAGVRLDITAASSVRVTWSEEVIETVLENLIDNATTFSPQGGTIRITLHQTAADATLTVEDDGPGVAEAELERIFERYVSNRPSWASAPGNAHFGIGLSIVRRNVIAIGGTVVAENRRTCGFRITIRLPLA